MRLIVAVLVVALCAANNVDLQQVMVQWNNMYSMLYAQQNATALSMMYAVDAVMNLPCQPAIVGRDAILSQLQMETGGQPLEISIQADDCDYIHMGNKSSLTWMYERGSYLVRNSSHAIVGQGNHYMVRVRSDSGPWYIWILSAVSSVSGCSSDDEDVFPTVDVTSGYQWNNDSALADIMIGAFARWNMALASGSGAAVAMMYTPDANLLSMGAPAMVGRTQIGEYFQGAVRYGVTRVDHHLIDCGVSEDDRYAYERGAYVLHGQNMTVLDVGKYALLWRQESQGYWLIHVDSFNSDR